jgi:Na+/melibiose symporter-like transporter
MLLKINAAKAPEDVTGSGLLIMKLAMLILPLIFIVIGYIIYYKKFKIDKQMYDSIISELTARGEINA